MESLSELDSVNGGAGIDTLFLINEGDYSLSGLTATQIKNVENIDLHNGEQNTLTFSDSWFDLHDTSPTTAVIDLDADDIVLASGSWRYQSNSGEYYRYENVIESVSVTDMGGTPVETTVTTTLTLQISDNASQLSLIASTDVNGKIAITSETDRFVTFDGAGSDGTLTIDDAQNASDLDLADLYYIDRIKGINEIDFLTGPDSDFIRISAVLADDILGNTGTVFTIRGAGEDVIELVGKWEMVSSGGLTRMKSEVYAGSGDYIFVDYTSTMATKSVTAGTTVFNGTSANNTFVAQSVVGLEVFGGDGDDTLVLGGHAALRIDLTDTNSVNSFANRVSDIENIDLSFNEDRSSIRLNTSGVAAITDSDNILDVVMDDKDHASVLAGGTSSTYSGNITVSKTTFHVFTISDGPIESVVRFVENQKKENVSWTGTNLADTLTIENWENLIGINATTGLNGTIDGGEGMDEIVLSSDTTGKTGGSADPHFDLTSTGSVDFVGIETITMRHSVTTQPVDDMGNPDGSPVVTALNQTLKLDYDSVAKMLNGSGKLTIYANDADTVAIGNLSNWTLETSSSANTQTYKNKNNTTVFVEIIDDEAAGNATIVNYDI